MPQDTPPQQPQPAQATLPGIPALVLGPVFFANPAQQAAAQQTPPWYLTGNKTSRRRLNL